MRGKKSHKGRTRQFTSPEEIDRQLTDAAAARRKPPQQKDEATEEAEIPAGSGDESNDNDSSGEDSRHKGVSHLIEVSNPNHVAGKKGQVSQVNLSKKEMEALTKATIDPVQLKTDAELANDMARLAMVRKQREMAARQREEERQAREAQKQAAEARAQAKLQALRDKRGGGATAVGATVAGRGASKKRGAGAVGSSPGTTEVSTLSHSDA